MPSRDGEEGGLERCLRHDREAQREKEREAWRVRGDGLVGEHGQLKRKVSGDGQGVERKGSGRRVMVEEVEDEEW